MPVNSESPVKSLYCVEFPGKVVNVDRAIQCLGGLNKISNACFDSQSKLECRFRPNEPFCKATVADRSKSSSFVIKVLIKRKKSRSVENENVDVHASVVGKVELVFRFCNLNDFQFLPMEKNVDGVYESIIKNILPERTVPLSWESKFTPFFFPPVMFARTDSVQPYLSSKVSEENSGLIGRTRDRRSNYVKFVSHDIKEVPTLPNENTLRYVTLKFVSDEQILFIRKLFNDRPVWTKSALECITRYTEVQLKYLLALHAYYFTSGPFRIAWVRFGYDPRKDAAARKYQVLDYRLRNYVLNIMRERFPERFSRGKTRSSKNFNDEKIYNPFDESHYKFKPGVIPPQKQIFYQICDIELPEIQEKLNNFSTNKEYDSKSGWLTELFLEKVRDTIDKSVLAAVTGSSEAANRDREDYLPIENVDADKSNDSAEEMDYGISDPDDLMDVEH